MTTNYFELSAPTALAFCEWFSNQGEARLQDLAVWVAGSGQSTDTFDFTWESLTPLWEWFLGFHSAGLPGVPEYVIPSTNQIVDGWNEPDKHDFRAHYAMESVAHYIKETYTNYSDNVLWDVMLRKGDRVRNWQEGAPQIRYDGQWSSLSEGMFEGRVNKLNPRVELVEQMRTLALQPTFIFDAFSNHYSTPDGANRNVAGSLTQWIPQNNRIAFDDPSRTFDLKEIGLS